MTDINWDTPFNSENLGSEYFRFQDLQSKLIKDIKEKEEAVIIERLNELGIDIDLELEAKRRFKNFSLESGPNKRILYYNDGSVDGLRVVTFETRTKPLSKERCSIGFETIYY